MGEISERPGNDSGRRTPRGLLALLVLVVVLLASATAGFATTPSVDPGAPTSEDSTSEVSTLAASGGLPKEVKYLCAAKKGGVLRYVNGPKRCTGKENLVRISSDRPITACASADSGVVRRISSSGKCRSGEDRMTLPGKERQRFCAAAGSGRLIYDPNSACEPEDTPVVVPAANKAPSARADALTVDEDGSVDLTLRATDPDGDRLTYALDNGPSHGDVSGSGTDRTYTPDPDFNGNDAFTFRASDGKGGADTARVTLKVTPVNDAPVAEDDTKFTPENTPLIFPAIDLLSNDSKGAPNENSQSLTVTSVSNAVHGAVDLDDKGNTDPSDDEVTFTPETDYKGPASFEYEMCDDGTPQLCSTQTATVSVAVTPLNSKPVATDDARTMDEDDPPITIDLATLVSDAETADADLTYTITDGPSASEGELSGSGSTRAFDSADDFNGTVEILYKVTDRGDPDNCGAPGVDCAESKDSDVAKVTVTIDPVNDTPVSTADDYEVDEDATLNVSDGPDDVLANDADADNDPLTAVLVSGPSHEDTFSLNPNGSFSYAPEADYNGDDSFTYKANDGTTDGNTVTVSITVKPVNDDPDAKDDAVTTDEDADAGVDVLSNDVIDPDTGEALSVQSVTTPSHGTASKITTGPDAGKVLYEPEAEYSGPDSFDYTIEDGNGGTDTATVNVTVDAVNDAPVVTTSSGSASYTEHQTGPDDTKVDPDLALSDVDDTSLDGAMVEITNNFASGKDNLLFTNTANISGVYNVTTGVLTLVGNAPLDEYRDALRSVRFQSTGDDPGSATRTVRFTADDGAASNNTGSANRDVDVTAVNDAPVNTVPSGPLTVAQDKDTSITGFSVADPDAGNSAVEVTLDVDHGEITLKDDVAGGLTAGNLDGSGSGTVTITGTLAKINATLGDPDGLVYHSAAAFTGADTLTMTTDDKGNTGTGGAQTDADTLDLDVKKINDAPVPTDDNRTTAEDDTLRFLASTLIANDSPGTNEAGQTLTVTAVNSTANTHGTVSLIPNGAGATDDEVRYVPDADYNGPASFQYIVQDDGGTANGGQDTATGTVNVTVKTVNDAPIATDDPAAGKDYSVAEDSTTALSVSVADGVLANDSAGPANESGQTLEATVTNDVDHGTLTLAADGSFEYTPTEANYNGTDAFTYEACDDGTTDGANDPRCDTATATITVTAVNDAPTANDDTGTTDEDTTLNVSAPGVLQNDTDPDAGDTKTINKLNGSATLTGTSQKGATVTVNANGSYTYNPGNIFQGLSTGQEDSDTFTYTMKDSANVESTATVTITIEGVSDAPVANADSFNGIGNTGLFVGTTQPSGDAGKAITGSVLSNDTDVDTPQNTLVAEPVTDQATTGGGKVTIESDGNFTYHPDDGDTGVNDTFSYRVCDASPCNSSTVTNSTGTVTIPLAGQVWYLKNNAAAGGDGTSDGPFDTIAEAETASSTGDTVFVFDGDNTSSGYATGFTMEANERLLGEVNGLTLDPDGGGSQPTFTLHGGTSGAYPTLTDNNADVVELDDAGEVRGIEVDPSGTGGGIAGASGDTGGGTIDNVRIIDTGAAGTQPGLELDATTGTFNVSNLTLNNTAAISPPITATGVRLNNAGTVDFGSTTINRSVAPAISATGTNLSTSTFDAITVTGGTAGGISLSTLTGTTSLALGDGTGTDLNITTSGGTGLVANNVPGLSVNSGGTDEIHSTNGPAVDVANSSGAILDFEDVDSTNSTTDGINLDTLGAGTFSADNPSSITGAAGIALDVNGGSGTVDYNGTIANGDGTTADITGRSGNTNLDGAITDTGDADATQDTAINISGNTSGTTSITSTKTLNTGEDNAIVMGSSDGHTLTISGGNLDIDTTSGKGLEAITSGTLNVTGTTNTINTTTGPALNVSNTDIGSSDLTFTSISAGTGAGSAGNGIVLNTTGSLGGLTVTGSGTAGSGGTIQHKTGADSSTTSGIGIYLNSAAQVSLSRMQLNDFDNFGIYGTSVNGFSLSNSVISGTIGDNTGSGDAPIAFGKSNPSGTNGLSGTSNSITDADISGGIEHNLELYNQSGSFSLSVTRANIHDNSVGGGSDGILMEMQGSAAATMVVDDSDFTNNKSQAFQAAANDQSSINLTVKNSTATRGSQGNEGFVFSNGADGDLTVVADNNVVSGYGGVSMFVGQTPGNASSNSLLKATITDNVVTAPTSATNHAIIAFLTSTTGQLSNARLLIDGNTVTQNSTGGTSRGILVDTPDSGRTPVFDTTVTNNTVHVTDNVAGVTGLVVQARQTASTKMCAKVAGNTVDFPNGNPGVNGVRVRQTDGATAQLERGTASLATPAATVLSTNNPASSTEVLGTVSVVENGTCILP